MSIRLKNTLIVLFAVLMVFTIMPTDSYAALKCKKTWDNGVSDKALNKYNGKAYSYKLPVTSKLKQNHCHGYVEWALNNVYDISPQISNFDRPLKVKDWLNKQGISVTEEELDKLVEAAVKTMNDKKVKTPSSIINIE